MKLEEVYNLLKKSEYSDFQKSSDDDIIFIYKNDISLSISSIESEEVYDYYNKEELTDYDKFVKEVCEINKAKKYYENIPMYTWIIKYNNNIIYKINSLHIGSGQTINFEIPYKLNLIMYDFELNFLKMLTDKYHQSLENPDEIIKKRITIKPSSFEDFIG